MKADEMFESLVENGLDFLNKAIKEFKTAPKYSVINFYSALELFLKARLMAEHWSLIVSKDPDKSKFQSGDFVSVSFEDSAKRLDRIIGQQIPENAIKVFDAVRRHRNKMVHFVHDSQADKASVDLVAAEQLRAWCELNKLLISTWQDVFAKYQGRFIEIENALTDHRKYLEAKFDSLADEIDKKTKAGVKFTECASCKFKAAWIATLAGELKRGACMVCSRVHNWVDITCPECEVVTAFDGGEYLSCENGHKLNESEIIDLLDEDDTDPWSGEAARTPANCGYCDGYHTVITYKNGYLCIYCLEFRENLEFCEWCNEGNTGDMDGSFWSGCNCCDGKSGWDSDD